MFRALRRWRARRRLEKDRQIYEYWDGATWRLGDPFLLWRGLMSHEKLNMETMLEAVDRGEEPETSIAIEAVCDIFGLVRWDPIAATGLTDDQVIEVLYGLATYFDTLKKTRSPGPISSLPTAPPSSTVQEPPRKATSSSSDSTPAATEPNSELPTEPSLP